MGEKIIEKLAQESEAVKVVAEDTVTITKKEYEYLLDREAFLAALDDAGVDNWSGYSYAWEIYNEN